MPSFFLILMLLYSTFVHATKFKISTHLNQETGYHSLENVNYDQLIFGFAKEGRASIQLNLQNVSDTSALGYISFCDVSDKIDRGFTLQRRHPIEGNDSFRRGLSKQSCISAKGSGDQFSFIPYRCVRKRLSVRNSISFKVVNDAKSPKRLYKLSYVVCNESEARPENNSLHKLTGSVEFTNPKSSYPQLGYDEVLFPILSITITAMTVTFTMILLLGLVLIKLWNLNLRLALPLVLIATTLKSFVSTIVFSFFWHLQQTGTLFYWYPYIRVAFTCIADVALITAAVAMSSGFVIMPETWFTHGRSPMILAYVCITLQVVIVVVLKLFFINKMLGIICFVMCGGCLTLILASSSHGNYNFCKRYSILVESSHILLKSTPISRMQLFFRLNTFIIITAYTVQVIIVIVSDLIVKRPDLLWGLMELVDAFVLGWFTLAVFPRKNSALYVDMSNLSNERLQRAQLWRAAQARLREEQGNNNSTDTDHMATSSATSTNGPPTSSRVHPSSDTALSDMENGRTETTITTTTTIVDSPQPPWIEWTSGMVLPRPDGATWGRPTVIGSGLNREQRGPLIIKEVIVIGSGDDLPDKLNITIGVPITGPESIPRVVDEKGRISAMKESNSRSGEERNNENSQSNRTIGRIEFGKRFRRVSTSLRLGDRSSSTHGNNNGQVREDQSEWPVESESQSTMDGRHDNVERRLSVGSSVASHDGYLYRRNQLIITKSIAPS